MDRVDHCEVVFKKVLACTQQLLDLFAHTFSLILCLEDTVQMTLVLQLE